MTSWEPALHRKSMAYRVETPSGGDSYVNEVFLQDKTSRRVPFTLLYITLILTQKQSPSSATNIIHLFN